MEQTLEQFGTVKLLHGDCLEALHEMPSLAYDLAIVDPPYGSGLDDNGAEFYQRFGERFDRYKNDTTSVERRGGTWASKYGNKIVAWDTAPAEEYFTELRRVSRNQIIWGANYFPNMPPTRCFVVWRKLTISEKFTMAMAEYAWTSFNQNAKVFEFAPQGKKSDPRFHPTQKPVELYNWLLTNFAKEGDKILDTHLGSGSSAVACAALGYEMLGIEIDDYYFAKACERLRRETRQLRLFT
jgi:site-specific DNA-methyltransferase (adenine-specific)